MNASDLLMPGEKLRFWAENQPDVEVLFQPKNGQLTSFTWQDIYQQAQKIASALVAMGLQQGSHIGLLSKNCAEWFIADFALMLGGYVSIPIYPSANAATIKYILEHAECKAIFVGKLDDHEEQEKGVEPSIVRIAMPYTTMAAKHQWDELLNTPITKLSNDLKPEDVMTILYTSGSTGEPKGAIHSYASFVNAGVNSGSRAGLSTQDRCVSYLPLAHCTERAYVESSFLSYGYQCYFTESIDSFSHDIRVASPTIFGSVPRLWTLFQKGILAEVPQKKLNILLKIPLVSYLLKRAIRKKLGFANTRIFISGSAPLSEKVLEWYKTIGIIIGEGWGMTETFAIGCTPDPKNPVKFGTISQPFEHCEIKIEEDGEILARTNTVMLGYYKDESKSKEVLVDGFVRTGDLGTMDSDGYVSITGRKKDIFKTEKGKYVAPVPIEKKFAENHFIEQMCLIGTTLKQPVLIVSLSQLAKTQEIQAIKQSLEETLNGINITLEKHEKVAHILVSGDVWSAETDELTPTLKVKRHVIEKKYLELAQKGAKDPIVWL